MTSTAGVLADMFRSHHRDVLRLTTRLVGNRDDGEDVAQETYLKLARYATLAEVIAFPKRYLIRAARNAAIDCLTRRNLEWSLRVSSIDIDQLASGHDTATAFEQKNQLARLLVSLNELPSACREAFLMNRVDGHGHQEISRRLNISVSMVEKHIMRAMRHCRDLRREAYLPISEE